LRSHLSLREAEKIIAATTSKKTADGPRRFLHSLNLVVHSSGGKDTTVFLTDPSWIPVKVETPHEVIKREMDLIKRDTGEIEVAPPEMDLDLIPAKPTPSVPEP
jgi:hypothetical protein